MWACPCLILLGLDGWLNSYDVCRVLITSRVPFLQSLEEAYSQLGQKDEVLLHKVGVPDSDIHSNIKP